MCLLAEIGGEEGTSCNQINIVAERTPYKCYYGGYAYAADNVAVIVGEQPFADAASAGRGAYHEHNPYHELTGEHQQP